MTSKTVNGTTINFNYSVDNRLEKVKNQSGAMTASYYFDPFGRRLWKDVAGLRTYFHYNDEGLAGEYSSAGSELKTYGYQPGSSWTTNPLFVQVGGEYYWYQNDHLGTPQKMISANGTVVWSARYDSFGLATVGVETVKNNLRFPGQYYDAETGLHYNWNRYYDPEVGRYISADPIGLDGGMNLYGYVGNDPVNWVDPFGLKGIFDFHFYRYYGGPGWTANRWASWNDLSEKEKRDAFDPKSKIYPRDAQDMCYLLHDKCYGDAPEQCEGGQELNKCDSELRNCLFKLGMMPDAIDEALRLVAIPAFYIQPAYRNRGYSEDGSYHQLRFQLRILN